MDANAAGHQGTPNPLTDDAGQSFNASNCGDGGTGGDLGRQRAASQFAQERQQSLHNHLHHQHDGGGDDDDDGDHHHGRYHRQSGALNHSNSLSQGNLYNQSNQHTSFIPHTSCTSIQTQNLSTSDQQPLIVDAHYDLSRHYVHSHAHAHHVQHLHTKQAHNSHANKLHDSLHDQNYITHTHSGPACLREATMTTSNNNNNSDNNQTLTNPTSLKHIPSSHCCQHVETTTTSFMGANHNQTALKNRSLGSGNQISALGLDCNFHHRRHSQQQAQHQHLRQTRTNELEEDGDRLDDELDVDDELGEDSHAEAELEEEEEEEADDDEADCVFCCEPSVEFSGQTVVGLSEQHQRHLTNLHSLASATSAIKNSLPFEFSSKSLATNKDNLQQIRSRTLTRTSYKPLNDLHVIANATVDDLNYTDALRRRSRQI